MQLLIQWIPELRRWHVAGPRGGLGSIKRDGEKYTFTPKGRRPSTTELALIYNFIAAKERRRKKN